MEYKAHMHSVILCVFINRTLVWMYPWFLFGDHAMQKHHLLHICKYVQPLLYDRLHQFIMYVVVVGVFVCGVFFLDCLAKPMWSASIQQSTWLPIMDLLFCLPSCCCVLQGFALITSAWWNGKKVGIYIINKSHDSVTNIALYIMFVFKNFPL